MTDTQNEKVKYLKEIIKRHNFEYESSDNIYVIKEGDYQKEMMVQLCMQIPLSEVPKLICEMPSSYKNYIYKSLMISEI